MAFPVPALHAVTDPPLVVEVPDDVFGRDVVVVDRLDVELEVADVEEVPLEVDTTGVGGLELHAPSAAIAVRVAAAPSPVHTRPSPTCRMASP